MTEPENLTPEQMAEDYDLVADALLGAYKDAWNADRRQLEAYEAQFKGDGITPYLDRMAELAARIEALMKMYQKETGESLEDVRRIMDDYVAALAQSQGGEEK